VEQVLRITMETSKHILQLHRGTPLSSRFCARSCGAKIWWRSSPSVIAIAACGESHHGAGLLQSFGHEVKLIAPQQARQERCGGRRGLVQGDDPDTVRAAQDAWTWALRLLPVFDGQLDSWTRPYAALCSLQVRRQLGQEDGLVLR